MTATVEPTTPTAVVHPSASATVEGQHFAVELRPTNNAVLTRRNALIAVPVWLGAIVFGFALVLYGFGPLFHQRDQRVVQKQARAAANVAANEATGLGGVTVSKTAPEIGSAVGILEIGGLRLQQGVVEGVSSSQTRRAPGHVPGTAGLGQPGNAVLVARNNAFGGTFGSINRLAKGDAIVVTTTQGQSVYKVDSVKRTSGRGAFETSKDDRLTLVTSASANPLNKSQATVVVAKMDGTPFRPTPQGTFSTKRLGTTGDSGALATLFITVVLYALVMVGGVVLYRRLQSRTAYLLTIAPVIASTIIVAETLSRVLPAWA